MKKQILATALAAPLILASSASAELLVGYRDFDLSITTSDTTPNVNLYGLDSELSYTGSNSAATSASGGSNNSTFADGLSATAAAPDVGQGAVVLVHNGSTVTLKITNNGSDNLILTNLLFDAKTTVSAHSGFNVDYGSGVTSYSVSAGGTTEAHSAFDQFAVPLSILLNPSQIFEVTFSVASIGTRLDNIGVTGYFSAIPEPSGAMALAGLLGAGAFMRSRRRA